MDKSLEIQKVPKLTQKEIENWNGSIMSKEITLVIKNFPTKKNPGPDGFTGRSYQIFREVLTWVLLKFFQKIEEDEALTKLLYTFSITVKPKSDKDLTRKGNHKLISLMNRDAKFLNKILSTGIQQYIKKIICPVQVRLTPGRQGWFNIRKPVSVRHYNTRRQKKLLMIISVMWERYLTKSNTLSW